MDPAACVRALLLITLLPGAADPGIRPSFDADECAFNATHIAVATEGEKIDGALEVLESWKGDLRKGDRITIPELAGLASEEARAIFRGALDKSAKRVSGSRMILFLVKTPLVVGPPSKSGAPPPGSGSGGIRRTARARK